MGVDLNEEVVNDTAKLVMHRLIARQLSRDPSVLLQATTYLKQMAERYPDRSFVGEWEDILKLPLKEIQSKLTSRNEEMTRLRLSSPFVLVNVGVDLRGCPITHDLANRRTRIMTAARVMKATAVSAKRS